MRSEISYSCRKGNETNHKAADEKRAWARHFCVDGASQH